MDGLQTQGIAKEGSTDVATGATVAQPIEVDASILADIGVEVIGFDTAKLIDTPVDEISATVGDVEIGTIPDTSGVIADPMIGTAF
jgi:hypothetical protein